VSASVAGGYRSGLGLAPACPAGRLGHSWFRFFPAASGRFASGSCSLSVPFQSSLLGKFGIIFITYFELAFVVIM